MYQLAIEDDPVNSALYDRFAWFLFNKTDDLAQAKLMAERAVQLNSKNCDATVNLALINYRLGDLHKGDEYIDSAKEMGRSISFCLLRKAIARYHHVSNTQNIDKSISLLENAEKDLDIAERQLKRTDNYFIKNQKDIWKYKNLTKSKLKTFRATRTKMLSSGKKRVYNN